MKKTVSLTENHIFRAAYRRGKSAARRTMVVYILKRRSKNTNRLGLTVSTKLGGAVVRNRIRRRLKECYRLNEDRFSGGFDLVIVARQGAVDAKFDVLEREMLAICRELGCLSNPREAEHG